MGQSFVYKLRNLRLVGNVQLVKWLLLCNASFAVTHDTLQCHIRIGQFDWLTRLYLF